MAEKPCTVLLHAGAGELPTIMELQKKLEHGSVEEKIQAMKQAILHHANGDPLPKLLMHVIRFVLPNKDHTLKKLSLLYWEVIDLTDGEGKLRPEVILVW